MYIRNSRVRAIVKQLLSEIEDHLGEKYSELSHVQKSIVLHDAGNFCFKERITQEKSENEQINRGVDSCLD